MRSKLWVAWIILLLVAGCQAVSPTPESAVRSLPDEELPALDERLWPLVELARADLARRQGIDSGQVLVQRVEEASFPDASLGVPEPGQVYAQAVTPGVVIRLISGGQVYRYHGSGDRVVPVPGAEASTEPVQTGAVVVNLFFGNTSLNRAGDCAAVFPVLRQIPHTYDLPRAVLEQLFAGPSEQELQQGYVSSFSPATAGALKSIAIEGETAYIDLVDVRPLMPAVSASCGRQAFFAEVETTLRHVQPLERVIYAIEGDPAPFYEWVQLACSEANDHCDRSPFEEQADGMTPAEVVAEYYTWHLGAGNVLVSKAYRSNDHLSAGFVRKVDEIIASFSRGGYDPFLCAQDIPRDMRLDPVQISGDEARVGVHGIWNPGTQYELANDILVVLQRQRGQWKIADIQCPGTQATTPEVQATGAGDGLESALADQLLNDRAGLCEWEVWGQGDEVLYLWAVCESASGTGVSAPAVVQMGPDGHIVEVITPGDGEQYGRDVRRLFPPEVQDRIFDHSFDVQAALRRIALRRGAE